MKLHQIMPQGMLFVCGGHVGISHNPPETIINDDAQLCVEASCICCTTAQEA